MASFNSTDYCLGDSSINTKNSGVAVPDLFFSVDGFWMNVSDTHEIAKFRDGLGRWNQVVFGQGLACPASAFHKFKYNYYAET